MLQHNTSQSLLLIHQDALYFVSGERRMKVPLNRITHISAGESGTVIQSLGRRYPTDYQLSDIMNQLPPSQFFRIHPLHIVALQHVQAIDGKEVMIASERLFTTHYYRGPLIEAFERRRHVNSATRTIKNRDTLL